MARRTAATAAVKIDQAQRARQVMQLRMAGASERTIAAQLGLSPGGVHKIIVRELATVRAETGEAAEEARKLELERLDQLQAALWPDAIGIDAQTGTRKAPSLQATDRVLRVMERRAALLGLDYKPKVEGAGEAPPMEFTLVIDGNVQHAPNPPTIEHEPPATFTLELPATTQ